MEEMNLSLSLSLSANTDFLPRSLSLKNPIGDFWSSITRMTCEQTSEKNNFQITVFTLFPYIKSEYNRVNGKTNYWNLCL